MASLDPENSEFHVDFFLQHTLCVMTFTLLLTASTLKSYSYWDPLIWLTVCKIWLILKFDQIFTPEHFPYIQQGDYYNQSITYYLTYLALGKNP